MSLHLFPLICFILQSFFSCIWLSACSHVYFWQFAVLVYCHFNSNDRKANKKQTPAAVRVVQWVSYHCRVLQAHETPRVKSCLLKDKHNLQVHLHNICLRDASWLVCLFVSILPLWLKRRLTSSHAAKIDTSSSFSLQPQSVCPSPQVQSRATPPSGAPVFV